MKPAAPVTATVSPLVTGAIALPLVFVPLNPARDWSANPSVALAHPTAAAPEAVRAGWDSVFANDGASAWQRHLLKFEAASPTVTVDEILASLARETGVDARRLVLTLTSRKGDSSDFSSPDRAVAFIDICPYPPEEHQDSLGTFFLTAFEVPPVAWAGDTLDATTTPEVRKDVVLSRGMSQRVLVRL